MNLQSLTNSRFGVGLGLALGRNVPTPLSCPVIRFMAKKMSRWQRGGLVQAVRRNQAMIHDRLLDSAELKRATEEVFRYTGRCFVDLYRNTGDAKKILNKIRINDDLERLVALSRDPSFGAFVVVPHMSSFDLMLLAAARLGLETKVLTFGQPTGGYKLQNEIRAMSGLDVMPISRRANLSALGALREGGFVLTAVDRPVAEQNRQFRFFGRPSPLPDGHIRMAQKADVPVLAAAVHMDDEGFYQLTLSEPVAMRKTADPLADIKTNAEAVLGILERYIRAHPTQWQMFYPVWDAS